MLPARQTQIFSEDARGLRKDRYRHERIWDSFATAEGDLAPIPASFTGKAGAI
ncbi:hypothetical protein HMPREF1862_01989 [Varibaculum cambriense]|uniref:Uncharacterized protein n=1 Tax=Varibaculum cambriense TaxID=184870 RepID=A0AB34WWW2_9ACTO|nr:hypothetical protein HMPREF1862_01989 [Varibaculum cambriense]